LFVFEPASQRASALITGVAAHPSCSLTDVFLLLLLLLPVIE